MVPSSHHHHQQHPQQHLLALAILLGVAVGAVGAMAPATTLHHTQGGWLARLRRRLLLLGGRSPGLWEGITKEEVCASWDVNCMCHRLFPPPRP